jgi:chemotaxis family two-component system response regulator Rcp1
VAEDNLPDVVLVREVIRMQGLPLEVHLASDGQKAIDFITNADGDSGGPCPQFLLLDLNLPKKDGFEVLQHVRASKKCKNVPVVIMTSSNAPADQARAAELGAKYFRKPANYDEFLKLGSVLRQLVEEKEHS